MDIVLLISLMILWNLGGALVLLVIAGCTTGWLGECQGWECVNPYWVYNYCKSVNWFGATVLALLCTVASPIMALIYWFYKLCTVGRR